MNNFTGSSCPVCNKKFTATDDIVVCPDCGAPHHRACYLSNNQCAFHDEHITGKAWKPNVEVGGGTGSGDFCINPQDGTKWDYEAGESKQCPVCGSQNPKDNIFCCTCGSRSNQPNMSNNSNVGEQRQNPLGEQRQNPLGGSQQWPGYGTSEKNDLNTAIYGSVLPQEDIGGITAREYAVFVGESSRTYLPKFKQEAEDSKSINFNLFAFLFPSLHFIYRKMYKIGFAFLAATILLSVPSILYQIETMPTIFNQSFEIVGESFAESQKEPIQEEIYKRINDIDNAKVARYNNWRTIADVIKMVLRFIAGFFGYKLYYRHAKNKINQAKAGFSDNMTIAEKDNIIQKAGGRSIRNIVILLIVYFLLNFGGGLYYTFELFKTALGVLF